MANPGSAHRLDCQGGSPNHSSSWTRPPGLIVASQKGFTLLELMIALAAMVLVSAVLGGVLRLGSRAWEKGEREIEIQQRNRDLVALLGQELRSAYPYPVRDGDRLIHYFQGDVERVSFVSTLSDRAPDGRAPLRLVMFFFEKGRGFYVWSTPVMGGGLPQVQRDAAYLVDGRVQQFQLRYLGPEGWVSSWTPKEITPVEVESRGLRGGQTWRSPAGPDPAPAIPQAVEITLALSPSRNLGPITLPIFAAIDLKKTNPAGRPGS